MHEFVSFNGQLVSAQQANLSAASSAAFYGKSVFTTVAVRSRRPFLWEKHWRRLAENAARCAIDSSRFSEKFVETALANLIKKNQVSDVRARLTLFDESGGAPWQPEGTGNTSLLITTAELRRLPERLVLGVSKYPVNSRSPLAGVKSGNYLENILAFREAAGNGFGEAVRLNEKDEIASACLANIFWVKGERILTPALETGALAGTTREFISENFAVTETRAALNELKNADSVFLASAGIGVVEAENLGRTRYASCEMFRRIKKMFERIR